MLHIERYTWDACTPPSQNFPNIKATLRIHWNMWSGKLLVLTHQIPIDWRNLVEKLSKPKILENPFWNLLEVANFSPSQMGYGQGCHMNIHFIHSAPPPQRDRSSSSSLPSQLIKYFNWECFCLDLKINMF